MKKYNAIDALLDYEDTSLSYTREVSCFAVPDHGILSMTTNNSAGAVEFDFFTIWEFLKKQEKKVEEAFMLHSHPPSMNQMSGIDRNMVYGWCLALGIPIWFLVITQDQIVVYFCELDKELKQVTRDYRGLYNHWDLAGDFGYLSDVMYGLSMSNRIQSEDLNTVMTNLNESDIKWDLVSYLGSW